MTPQTLIKRVENLLSDTPSADTLAWLRSGFAEHISKGEPLSNTLGFSSLSRGLPDTFRHYQRKRYIFAALALADDPACSIQSTAKRLAGDMLRLATRGKPRNPYEKALHDAIQAHPFASIEADSLWYIVREYRRQNPNMTG